MRSVRIFAAGFTLTALSSLLQPALSQDPIKIGVMFPYTGPISAQGRPERDAITQAFDEEKNMIAGRKIELLLEDSTGRPDTGLTKIKALVERDKAHLLLSELVSSVGAAIAPYVNEQKIPWISTVALASLTRRRRVYIFVSFRRPTSSERSPPRPPREWDGRRLISSDGTLRQAARPLRRSRRSLALRTSSMRCRDLGLRPLSHQDGCRKSRRRVRRDVGRRFTAHHPAIRGVRTEQEDAVVWHRLVYQRGAPRRHAAGRRRYPQRVYLLRHPRYAGKQEVHLRLPVPLQALPGSYQYMGTWRPRWSSRRSRTSTDGWRTATHSSMRFPRCSSKVPWA